MCLCGNVSADFFVLATVARPITDGLIETGYVDEYICREHMPNDSNDLLSSELLDEGWQVYEITVGTRFPCALH